MKNPDAERWAFCSLSKYIEGMNHQCECITPCKEKLPCDTKINNVHVRSYSQIRAHKFLDQIKVTLNQSMANLQNIGNCQLNNLTVAQQVCLASEFIDL